LNRIDESVQICYGCFLYMRRIEIVILE